MSEMTNISVEWVKEIPASKKQRGSKYDAIADRVRAKGGIARIEAESQKQMSNIVTTLRSRFKDLKAASRTIPGEGFFVYLSRREED